MRELDPPLTLAEIAEFLDVPIDASAASQPIRRIAPIGSAGESDLCFLSDARYASQLTQTKAAAVLVDADRADAVRAPTRALVVADPYQAFAKLTGLFHERLSRPADNGVSSGVTSRVDPSARIHDEAVLDASAHVQANCSIAAGARIGPHVQLQSGCVIGERVVIGAHSVIGPNVTIYADSTLGTDCTVQAGTVIGSDGFGYARSGTGWTKIWQLGNVVIGDRVEIGANCCVDRGALEDTVIGDDCILDNLIQVAHNVRIGSGSALAGCVGIAGSAQIGSNCLIGGGAGILGHLSLADDVVVSPMSLVTRSIRKPGFYSGSFPLMENAQWEKAAATLRRLPDLRSRLRQLEKLTQETQ